jgi:phenylpropionate dioxygenase-like ring-hydroxylating dioxygenase large terminal subunit
MNDRWQVTGREAGVTRYPEYDAAVLGFGDYWYPAMESASLRNKPVGLVLFGQRIMFYRDQGKPYALENRCPHRGIQLSIGRQEFPGTFTCRYHGWTFDLKTGTLMAALTDGPDCPMRGRVAVRTYPTAEAAGVVWIFFGQGNPPTLEADVPEELLRKDAVTGLRITERDGDWRHAAENGFDEGHGKYLHRDSIFVTFAHPPAWVHSDTVEEPGGWITRKATAQAFQSDYPGLGTWPKMRPWKTSKILSRASIRLPGVLRIHFGEWIHFEWYVPTVPGRHRYVQLAVKNVRGIGAIFFKLRYWTYLRWLFHGAFNDQDARVVEMMQTPPERLFRPDLSIVHWRQLAPNARGGPIPSAPAAQPANACVDV